MSSIVLFENEVSTAIKCSIWLQDNYFAVGTMAESLHTQLRTSLEILVLRLLIGCISKDLH